MKSVLRTIVVLTLTVFVTVLVSAATPTAAKEHGRGFMTSLSEEQRESVERKIKVMRDQGASRREIRAAVGEMLKGYGIELPKKRVKDRIRKRVMAKLTEAQRKAVKEKTREMRDRGADRKEIKSAVTKMLKGYGIKLPRKHIRDSIRKRVAEKLTEDQRKAVGEKVKEMRDRGASRKEIRAAKNEMLKGYGIQLSERRARGRGRRKLMEKLTDEQRKAVREKVKEMRARGASRKEIRAGVNKILEGYGVKKPEGSGAMSSARKSGGPHIVAQAFPNPFDSEANISYALNDPGNVRVSIYNTAGQLIRSFDMGVQDAGTYTVHWDGNHEDGTPATSGVYLYRIDAGDQSVTNRMVLLK